MNINVCDYWGYGRQRGVNALLDIDFIEEDDVTEPVALYEAKWHLAITHTDDDDYLRILIKAARSAVEKYTGLSLVEKQVILSVDNYEGNFALPYGPIIGTPAALDTSGDVIDDVTFSGVTHKNLVSPKYGEMQVSYTAGYEVVPADLKLAILHEIAYQYQHRGDEAPQEGLSPIAKGYAKMHRRVPKVL